jgi:hypothetical protein
MQAWANRRLSALLGTNDVADVAEYMLGIEDQKELMDFVSGMLPPDQSAIFYAELQERKAAGENAAAGAATSMPSKERSDAQSKANDGAQRSNNHDKGGAAKGVVSSRDRDLQDTRNLLNMRTKNEEAQAALDRLQRNTQSVDDVGKGREKGLPALGQADGMIAYLKGGNEDDEFNIGGEDMRKKKGKSKSKGSEQDASSKASAEGNLFEEPVFAKPKLSRGRRAEMLRSSMALGGGAFLVPGRRVTAWVGHGDDYKSVCSSPTLRV